MPNGGTSASPATPPSFRIAEQEKSLAASARGRQQERETMEALELRAARQEELAGSAAGKLKVEKEALRELKRLHVTGSCPPREPLFRLLFYSLQSAVVQLQSRGPGTLREGAEEGASVSKQEDTRAREGP